MPAIKAGERRVIQDHIGKYDVCFDVGCCIGEWSSVVRQCHRKTTIHAFEPVTDTGVRYVESQLGYKDRTFYNNSAVSDKSGETELFIYDGICFNSLFYVEKPRHKYVKKLSIPCVSVDDYCEENEIDSIDFMKIDVEGGEIKVLQGSKKMFGRIKKIQFEYGMTYRYDNIKIKDAFDILCPAGYDIHIITRHSDNLIPEYTGDIETYHYDNFLAILR